MLAVAHSGEFVACAVSTRRLGVDIERSDRVEADHDLARRVCTAHERRQLERLPAPLRRAALIRQAGAGADHPAHPLLPETAYLKALVFALD